MAEGLNQKRPSHQPAMLCSAADRQAVHPIVSCVETARSRMSPGSDNGRRVKKICGETWSIEWSWPCGTVAKVPQDPWNSWCFEAVFEAEMVQPGVE